MVLNERAVVFLVLSVSLKEATAEGYRIGWPVIALGFKRSRIDAKEGRYELKWRSLLLGLGVSFIKPRAGGVPAYINRYCCGVQAFLDGSKGRRVPK